MRKTLMACVAALLMSGPAFAQSSDTGSGASLHTHPQLNAQQPAARTGGPVKGGASSEGAETTPEAAEKGTKPGSTVEPGSGTVGGMSPETTAPQGAQMKTKTAPQQSAQMPTSGGGGMSSSSMSGQNAGQK